MVQNSVWNMVQNLVQCSLAGVLTHTEADTEGNVLIGLNIGYKLASQQKMV